MLHTAEVVRNLYYIDSIVLSLIVYLLTYLSTDQLIHFECGPFDAVWGDRSWWTK